APAWPDRWPGRLAPAWPRPASRPLAATSGPAAPGLALSARAWRASLPRPGLPPPAGPPPAPRPRGLPPAGVGAAARERGRRRGRGAADRVWRRQRALRAISAGHAFGAAISRAHAKAIGPHEAKNVAIAGVNHEPAVVAAAIDRRDGVDHAAQVRDAE